MESLLGGFGIGVISILVVMLLLRFRRRGNSKARTNVTIRASIDEMRAIGELSVFKVITSQIVTADKHVFGPKGRKYLNWMMSSKKMAMIITFDIEFRYDLQDSRFKIEPIGGGTGYLLKMPKCFYRTHITDLSIYDEQRSEFLPALMPDLLSKVFGGNFTAKDKNDLIDDAKRQASKQAEELVSRMRSEVQNSARLTLSTLARGFGAEHVEFDFEASEPIQQKVSYDAQDAA